ncbi:hypothetical protein [Streptomyces sp. CRN 30]|uniref:hypothetical protein n=1 Tax=Streptomyces sp. CRN 30 TaxID=3075613 RepID=UPI002A7F50B6|nr:hypothetical protein [Streptomyces sp. CRN 30]
MSSASGKTEIVQFAAGFGPDWLRTAVLVLIVLAVVARWTVKLRRGIDHRRAARAGEPGHQGRGTDYLGSYAPQRVRDDGRG